MNRALALELEALDQSPLNPMNLALVLRYRTTAERNFYKALAEIQRLRTAMRRDAEREERDREKQVRRELDRLILAPFAPAHKFVSQDLDKTANSSGFVSQNRPEPLGTAMPFISNVASEAPVCPVS